MQFIKDNTINLGEEGKDEKYGYELLVLPNPDQINIHKYIGEEKSNLVDNERSSNVQAYNDLEGHWIEEDVKVVEENDPGADGGFHSDEFVIRAQLVKVVRRLQGY